LWQIWWNWMEEGRRRRGRWWQIGA
jgi:hypothetical protein